MAKEKKNLTLERIVLGTDRKNAQTLRKLLIKVLAGDKKSDGLRLTYLYRPLRRRAEYTVEGHPKTVKKCLTTLEKFLKKQEQIALRLEAERAKAQPLPKGKYYTMKPLKERRTR